MKIQYNNSLLPYNTFGMDVKCKIFAEYSSREELVEFLQSEMIKENKFFHIGGGSNLLFTGDYEGVILHSAIRFIEKVHEDDSHVWIKAGSGIVWDELCRYAVDKGWGGMENLSLIPGEVGATAVQNIGAYGVEVADIIESVDTIEIATGEQRVFNAEECQYGYRSSIFKNALKGQYIVVSVTYKLDKHITLKLNYGNLMQELAGQEPITPAKVRSAVIAVRESKLPDPAITGNAGSFFMNPVISERKFTALQTLYPGMPHYPVDEDTVKVPAGWLIEQCGWKGKEWGGAAVHEKQCLVLINKHHAKASDVQGLAEAICKSVFDKFGIEIHPEVNYI